MGTPTTTFSAPGSNRCSSERCPLELRTEILEACQPISSRLPPVVSSAGWAKRNEIQLTNVTRFVGFCLFVTPMQECMLSPVPVGCYCTAPVSPKLEQSRCNSRTLAENRPPRSQERLRHPPWARCRQFKCLTRRLKLPQEKGAGTRTAARAPGDAPSRSHSMWGAASAASSPGEQPPAFGRSLTVKAPEVTRA